MTTNSLLSTLTPFQLPYTLHGIHINQYAADGFVHVCNVSPRSTDARWLYSDINEGIMYANYRCWLYLITVNDIIYKIGETANPLGLRKSASQTQPNTGSASRLGRYINGDGTDRDIRLNAHPYILNGYTVSVYAKKCEILTTHAVIAGDNVSVACATQKDQELQYLDQYRDIFGRMPMWNKSRK